MTKLLLTLEEVAELTGFSLRSLEDDARAGVFEHVHRGRERFMTREQINRLIANHTVVPAGRAAEQEALDKVRQRLAHGRRKPPATTHLVDTPHPEAVRAPRRGRAAKADPFAVLRTDESRMAERIDEAFGDAS